MPNCKMKDCQTVKYDWLVKLGMIGRLISVYVRELLDGLIEKSNDWFTKQRAERVCQTHAQGAKNRHGS